MSSSSEEESNAPVHSRVLRSSIAKIVKFNDAQRHNSKLKQKTSSAGGSEGQGSALKQKTSSAGGSEGQGSAPNQPVLSRVLRSSISKIMTLNDAQRHDSKLKQMTSSAGGSEGQGSALKQPEFSRVLRSSTAKIVEKKNAQSGSKVKQKASNAPSTSGVVHAEVVHPRTRTTSALRGSARGGFTQQGSAGKKSRAMRILAEHSCDEAGPSSATYNSVKLMMNHYIQDKHGINSKYHLGRLSASKDNQPAGKNENIPVLRVLPRMQEELAEKKDGLVPDMNLIPGLMTTLQESRRLYGSDIEIASESDSSNVEPIGIGRYRLEEPNRLVEVEYEIVDLSDTSNASAETVRRYNNDDSTSDPNRPLVLPPFPPHVFIREETDTVDLSSE